MIEMMTAPDVSKKLGVAVGTIKNWAERVGVGTKNSMGVWFFSDPEIHILEVVKTLREEDRGFDTITRRLQEVATAANNHQQEPSEAANSVVEIPTVEAENEPLVEVVDSSRRQQLPTDGHALLSQMISVVQEQTEKLYAFREQTEQMGQLREQLGEMRERMKWVTAERDLLQREVKLLKAPEEEPSPEEPVSAPEPAKRALGERLRLAWRVVTGGPANNQ